jgi:hypothetical protein
MPGFYTGIDVCTAEQRSEFYVSLHTLAQKPCGVPAHIKEAFLFLCDNVTCMLL